MHSCPDDISVNNLYNTGVSFVPPAKTSSVLKACFYTGNMPPKRRPRGGANSQNLFHYNNQVEVTFKAQPKENTLERVGDSGSDDDNVPVLRKKGKIRGESSSSSESSEASDSEPERDTKTSDDK